MPFLSEQDRQAVRTRLENDLVEQVRVLVFSEVATGLYVPGRRECITCADTEALMMEVAELSDKIHLEINNVRENPELAADWGVSLTPTVAVCRETDSGVRFLGIPGGYEFLSFLETLISASAGNGAGLEQQSVEKLSSVGEDLEIKIFVTPT